jgi:hypothetical protein
LLDVFYNDGHVLSGSQILGVNPWSDCGHAGHRFSRWNVTATGETQASATISSTDACVISIRSGTGIRSVMLFYASYMPKRGRGGDRSRGTGVTALASTSSIIESRRASSKISNTGSRVTVPAWTASNPASTCNCFD